MISGTYDCYKAKRDFNNNTSSTEDTADKMSYNLSKITLGAARLTSLGFLAASKLGYLGDGFPNQALDTGLMFMFAATYAVEFVMKTAPSLLKTEAINHKKFQTKILEDNNFFNFVSKETELPLNESYQLFLFGSSLASSNIAGKAVFYLKNKINEIQANWSEKELTAFNKIQKKSYSISQNFPTLKNFINKISEKAHKKRKANLIIKEHSDFESPKNNYFMQYINETKGDKSQDFDTINKDLKEINEKAILDTYTILRKQNIELLFTKVVSDYNFGLNTMI